MNRTRIFFTALLAGFLIGAATIGCGSSATSAADDDSTYATMAALTALQASLTATQAQVTTLQAQVTTLQTQITALPVARPAVFIKGPAVAAKTSRTRAVAGCVSSGTLGTLTGRPSSSNPISDDDEAGISSTGYYFTITSAPTANDCGYLQTIPYGVTVYFSDALCHDVEGVSGMSNGAIAQGFVFHMDLDGTDPAFTDAGHYWSLVAGKSPVSMNYQSLTAESDKVHVTCLPTFGTTNNSGTTMAYPVQNNDTSVTGIPNAPVQGPITVTP